jgi:hypothetical protein
MARPRVLSTWGRFPGRTDRPHVWSHAPHRLRPAAHAAARGVRLRRAGRAGPGPGRPCDRAAGPAGDSRRGHGPARRDGWQPAAQAGAGTPRRPSAAAGRPGLRGVGGALFGRHPRLAPGHGPARSAPSGRQARQGPGPDRNPAGPDDPRPPEGAGGRRAGADRLGRPGDRGRGLGRGGQGPGRRGRAGRRLDRAGRQLPPAGPVASVPGPQSQPAGLGRRAGRDAGGRRLPGGPAGRGDRLGQDRGLSGGRGRRPGRRPGQPGADPAARDRPDPGGAGPLRGPVRRRAGRVALGRFAAQAPAGLGRRGHRRGAHRGRGPLGPVPAVSQAAAGGGRRGARRLVQAGGGLHLPGSRPGRGPRQDRGGAGGAGLGHAVAGKPVERPAGPLSLASAERPPRRGPTARHRPDRHARDPARAGPLAVAAAGQGRVARPVTRRADLCCS